MSPLIALSLCVGWSWAQSKQLVRADTPQGPGEVRVRVFAMGVSDFAALDEGMDLHFAAKDAELFVRTLLETSFLPILPEDVTLLTEEEATRSRALSELDRISRESDENDVIILFFSTHGATIGGGQGYLLTWDSELGAQLPTTSLSTERLGVSLEQTRAQQVLLFTDACHSAMMGYGSGGGRGNAINSALWELNEERPTLFNHSSSLVSQESVESEAFCGGQGAYTCALTLGMRGAADSDRDGVVRLGELATYVGPVVMDMVQEAFGQDQLPEHKGYYASEQPFTRASEASPPLPPPPPPPPPTIPRQGARHEDTLALYVGVGLGATGSHREQGAGDRWLRPSLPMEFRALWGDSSTLTGFTLTAAPVMGGLTQATSGGGARELGLLDAGVTVGLPTRWGQQLTTLGVGLPSHASARVGLDLRLERYPADVGLRAMVGVPLDGATSPVMEEAYGGAELMFAWRLRDLKRR